MVEYNYDDLGRLVHRAVRDRPLVMTGTPMEDSSSRFEVDYQYDGRGRLVRERILRYDLSSDRMVITQDVQTTYDLGNNPTEIKFYDNAGWAYTETRTYARGYQLTGSSFQSAADINTITSGNYTYDTNNNLTEEQGLSVEVSAVSTKRPPGVVLLERMARTFTYDRKNRLKSFTLAPDMTRHLWWDGLGRVWQRWDYDEQQSEWLASLTRYVYDGGTLAQEHGFYAVAVQNGGSVWVYTYVEVLYDYLYGPMGVRQRAQQGGGTFVDSYLLADRGTVTASIDRSTSSTVKRVELTASGDRQSYGSTQEGPISNFGYLGGFVEGYSNYSFDPLAQFGSRHYLAGLGININRSGNNPYRHGGGGETGYRPSPSQPPSPSPPAEENVCTCMDLYRYSEWMCRECCFPQVTLYELCCTTTQLFCFVPTPDCAPGVLMDIQVNEICGPPGSELRKCICRNKDNPILSLPCVFYNARLSINPECATPCGGKCECTNKIGAVDMVRAAASICREIANGSWITEKCKDEHILSNISEHSCCDSEDSLRERAGGLAGYVIAPLLDKCCSWTSKPKPTQLASESTYLLCLILYRHCTGGATEQDPDQTYPSKPTMMGCDLVPTPKCSPEDEEDDD